MAALDAVTTRKALVKKGFVLHNGDHNFYLYYHNGKLVAKTKMSHNGQDINDSLISKMRKQCKLTRAQFLDLVNCPLTEEAYVDILKGQGLLT